MKKQHLLFPLTVLAATVAISVAPFASAKGQKEKGSPTLLTIAGKPVGLDEFEYLYHKNNAQQLAPQTVDEYLEMFITYKQKVAAAEEAGIDQIEAFQKEFEGYRRDLAAPYLTDAEFEDSLFHSLYQRMLTQKDVSHIMVPLRTPAASDEKQRAFLDSLRTAILTGGADFEATARQYSSDGAAKRNGGRMGWLPFGRVPYTFEDAAYATAVGDISPVIATPFGYHIVKVNAERPAQGEVLVEHVLKLTQGLPPEEAAAKKAQIDSIYQVITTSDADFETVAKTESEDPGSAQNGGRLPWFGTGRMVPEFEEVSFALDSGMVSQPFATSYGYHIVKKLGTKPVDTYEQALPTLKKTIAGDERGQLAKQRFLDRMEKKFSARLFPEAVEALKQQVAGAGRIDSAMIAEQRNNTTPVGEVLGKNVTAADVFANITPNVNAPLVQQLAVLDQQIRNIYDDALLEAAREDLANTNPDYRHLLNEYRDGILLFEISDREVWSRSKNEPQALEQFFNEHRGDYTWAKPKFKGFVIFATSDSVMLLAKDYLDNNPNISPDSISRQLRKEFGKNVRAERVLASQGENPIIDNIAFDGPEVGINLHWPSYFPYKAKVISAPEEVADERGAITTDYQAQLEQQWLESLKQRFPVKVNKKTLKKAQ